MRLALTYVDVDTFDMGTMATTSIVVPRGCRGFVIKPADAAVDWYWTTSSGPGDPSTAWHTAAGEALRIDGPCYGQNLYVVQTSGSTQRFLIAYEEAVSDVG